MYDIISILSSKLGDFKRENDKQLLFYCKDHSHHKPKLAINIEKGVYRCWIGGESGTIYKLFKTLNCSEAEILFAKTKYYKNYNEDISEKIIDNSLIKSDFDKYAIKLNTNAINFYRQNILQYLKKRNVVLDDIITYDLRYGIEKDYQNTCIIPSYDEKGNLNYLVTRKIFDIEGSPYKNSKGSKQDIIFNDIYIDWEDDIYLVEGFFDYVKCKDFNVVNCLGSEISEDSLLFNKLIMNSKKKYILFDRDAYSKSLKFAKKMVQNGCKGIFILDWNKLDKTKKDLGDFENKDIVKNILENSNNFIEVTLHNINELEILNML